MRSPSSLPPRSGMGLTSKPHARCGPLDVFHHRVECLHWNAAPAHAHADVAEQAMPDWVPFWAAQRTAAPLPRSTSSAHCHGASTPRSATTRQSPRSLPDMSCPMQGPTALSSRQGARRIGSWPCIGLPCDSTPRAGPGISKRWSDSRHGHIGALQIPE